MKKILFLIALAFLPGACQPDRPPQPASAPVSTSAAEHGYTAWAGRWIGVEGTYLDIAPQDSRLYAVTIADLDGPRVFPGADEQHGIAFTRDGKRHVIHAGSGDDTGMKWLAGKRTCLIVTENEGYCRD